jgi:hypothetical protein
MRACDAAEIYALRPNQNAYSLYRDMAMVRPYLWFEVVRPVTSMTPVALFGVAALSPGVAQAHMFATDDMTIDHARQIADRVKGVVIPTLLDAGLHRVQAQSLAGYVWAHRFMRRCGARFEAPCWSLGADGQDYASFVWLKRDLDHLYQPQKENTQ